MARGRPRNGLRKSGQKACDKCGHKLRSTQIYAKCDPCRAAERKREIAIEFGRTGIKAITQSKLPEIQSIGVEEEKGRKDAGSQ
jgi:hypothetical protein